MSSGFRLLMVEDSPDDAELLLYALRDAPFKFTATRVETEAEYEAALAEALPDVVLCDYHLPRFSADRALQILNERLLDVPFIVVSHHIGEDAAVAAMQNGASDYLMKNRLGRLPKAIESAIERRVSRQQQATVEEKLRTSEAMKRGILNSLNTRIAVVDGQGIVVATNKAWDDFGDARAQLQQSVARVGADYFALLQAASDRGNGLANRVLKDLRAVISRETGFTSMEYEISVPGGTRWFIARAMRLADSIDGAVLLREDVTDRILAHHALGEANKRLQAMSKRLLSIQEEERRGISLELHDDIGQSMTALKIGLHRLALRATSSAAEPAAAQVSEGAGERAKGDQTDLLAECLHIADTTLDKLRNLSLELRPPQLDQLGLEDALNWLVDHHRDVTGLDVTCQFAGLAKRLPAELESVCYRISQEALNNATRHARANQIRIRVERMDRLLTLTIRDDGVGFDMDVARKKALKSGSLGLISMDERAQLAGGRLKVRTVPGAGTTVQVTFVLESVDNPLAGEADESGEQHAAPS